MDFKEYNQIVDRFVPTSELEERTLQKMNQKRKNRPVELVWKYAAVVFCLLLFAPASVIAKDTLFSDLRGDELALSSTYEGAGVVSVYVENKSDKELEFQPKIKLMQWTTGEAVEPLSENISFSNTKISAHSSGVMTIDLSKAYDIASLEEPLTEDWYYLVLTNENFIFGQDWMCSIDFAGQEEIAVEPESEEPVRVDAIAVQNVKEELRFYFENPSWDTEDRRALDAEYVKAYETLLAEFEGNVISSVSPVLPGNKISLEKPSFSVKDLEGQSDLISGRHWTTRDVNFKLLGREDEYALKLSVGLPIEKYDGEADMPLFYIMAYEKEDIEKEENYVFLCGQLLTVAEMEQYKVLEDEQLVFYEISGLLYSDLEAYVQSFVEHRGDVRYDEYVWEQILTFYSYYKENLKDLIYYK